MWQISGTTRLYAILADPVHHVQTPQLVNQFLRQHKVDAVLVPWHVRPQHLACALQAARQMENLGGFIVTVPHKIAVVSHCDILSEEVGFIGAANCVRREPDGSLVAAMLDGTGFVTGLTRAGHRLENKSVFMAGAGGAACAIAFALAQSGICKLTIGNRSHQKAVALVEKLQDKFPDVDFAATQTGAGDHDVLINATSLGLYPGDAPPLDFGVIQTHHLLAEIIMQPEVTPFLQTGLDRGCTVHKGLPMLQSQLELMAAHLGMLATPP